MKRIIFLCFTALLFIQKVGAQQLKSTKNQTNMNTDKITNPVAKAAIDALQKGDSQAWSSAFATGATFYDDGNRRDLAAFNKSAIGHERFTSIDKVENNGTAIYGNFHSDQWGDFKTYFRFTIDNAGKITKLEIGQASY